MSRIGKLPIALPPGVAVKIQNQEIEITGPKGVLHQTLVPEISVEINENKIIVRQKIETGKANALHGLFRSLVNNMVYGVTNCWSKTLELTGVGYKAQLVGDELILNLGFSHSVKFKKPEKITFTVLEKEGRIMISGPDKQLVGETAAKIRKIRPPEPYKGKGIHYVGEKIKRKAGKSVKTVGAAGAK